MSPWLWGAIGGVVAEFLVLLPYRQIKVADWPNRYRRLTYWAFSPFLIAIGALAAFLLTRGQTDSAYIAVQAGGTAPLVFEKLYAAVPPANVGTTG